MIKKLIILSSLTLLLFACEKVVDIEETEVQPVVFCQVGEGLQGDWISDSVHITSEVDTIDSLIINKQPTLFYELKISCGETDDDKRLRLSYTNFSGVETEDILSTNFISSDKTIYIFNTFDESLDTAQASFRLRYVLINSNQGEFRFTENPNPGQKTHYKLYLQKSL
ncbi:MAG: hypothetical protein WEC59_05890 [Salibacteraceae bacterium]